MKRVYYPILMLLFSINLFAQENGNVTVHLGEGASLESLLAGYENESIKSVVITGTPTCVPRSSSISRAMLKT